MSRARYSVIALGMAFALPTLSSASAPSGARAVDTPQCSGSSCTETENSPVAASDPSSLAGRWQSGSDETPLNAAYQEAIWGRNAKEVRTVEMVVRTSGDATVTVTRKVVDGRGRTARDSTSIEQADVHLGAVEQAAGRRSDVAVTVTRAERRYPDDPAATWNLDGLRIVATAFPDDPSQLEIRLEYPDGRRSFVEVLRRTGPTRPDS